MPFIGIIQAYFKNFKNSKKKKVHDFISFHNKRERFKARKKKNQINGLGLGCLLFAAQVRGPEFRPFASM